MRTYYHFYPTCPSCNEPHVDGSALKVSGDELVCSSCHANFRKYVDLESHRKFSKTINAATGAGKGGTIINFPTIPPPWKIKLNIIEDEYVSWIKQIETGSFLITWPWKDVKFIPVLLGEYLLNNPGRKAAVIGKFKDNSDVKDVIGVPAINEVFDSLIYTELPELTKIDDKIIEREMKQFSYKNICNKKKVVNYVVKEMGSRGYRREDLCIDTPTKCKNRVVKEIKDVFGKDSIRELKIKKNTDNGWKKITNEKGFVDIKLVQREQWMCRELKYKKQWLWNVLLNWRKFSRLSRVIPAVLLKDPERLSWGGERLFFISSEIDFPFGLVESIKPHLLIIQNIDDFMYDAVYTGRRSKVLFDFLSRFRNSLTLMFSTNPEVRYLYGINYPGEYTKNYGVNNQDFITHTWDSEIIVNKIRSKLIKNDPGYSTPASSRPEELPVTGRIPETEYIRIDSLDGIDDLIHELLILVDNDLKPYVKRYIYDLRKTPLLVRGDYTKPEVFRRGSRSSGYMITYDYLISLIFDRCDEERFKKIKGSIDRIYATESGTGNPILVKMSERISELLRNEDNFVTVIVHKYDVRGTEKLLRDMGYNDYIPKKLTVCSWSDLPRRGLELTNEVIHYVISTLPPSLEYEISSSGIRKIIFVGGRRFTEKIEGIMKYRLAEQSRRPLYRLSNERPAPRLLKEILQEEDIPSNEDILDLTDEIIVELEESSSNSHGEIGGTHHPVALKPGEKAILVVSTDRNGVFIPEGTSLLVKDGSKVNELAINDVFSDTKILSKLTGKEILLYTGRLYFSFREDFMKLMMNYGKKIRFKKGPYSWEGFHELFSDAIHWIDLIKRAINVYSSRNSISYEEAEDKISGYLSSLSLTAKDPGYIKSWWSRSVAVLTESGSYDLYRVEHPKSLNDLVKIYTGIGSLLPELNVDPADARRSYAASIFIQKFRRSVLKEETGEVSFSLKGLHSRILYEVNKVISRAETFRVNLVNAVKIAKEVEPFKLMIDFENYIEK